MHLVQERNRKISSGEISLGRSICPVSVTMVNQTGSITRKCWDEQCPYTAKAKGTKKVSEKVQNQKCTKIFEKGTEKGRVYPKRYTKGTFMYLFDQANFFSSWSERLKGTEFSLRYQNVSQKVRR